MKQARQWPKEEKQKTTTAHERLHSKTEALNKKEGKFWNDKQLLPGDISHML